ncbi:probable ATP-dependent RNA helicase DDX52 [Mya arenaria]|uniref:probable ATP-dependent RNA helicase DDX52 n=1 Tax=Mya arenaria TaxID=6604 RepID=UPI0022E62E20|nr:probable ATP-dependent RNA helicase DDX52 [Mya arenaria]
MDAYDLFKKLGAGAKFDFKRFRSDAEKLHILKRKEEPSHQKIDPVGGQGIEEEIPVKKSSVSANVSTDEENESSSESDSDSKESSGSSSSSESESEHEEGLEQETEGDIQLLGNIRSKGDIDVNLYKEQRKERKKKKKDVNPEQKQAELKQEQINHVRNVNRIHVYGTDVPEPAESFDELKSRYNINARIIENIQGVGYTSPTPIQMQAVPAMLARRELMACAPTGSGKTAAFILPILHQLREPRNDGIRALILSPTRELAKQTYREFQRLSEGIGFRILYIDKIGSDVNKMKKISKKVDILVSTPNRLLYLLKQSPPVISLTSVQWLVVDESDKLFEEGKTGFRDQLALIYKSCDGANLRRAMFSATFAFDVEEWCKLNLDNVVQVYVGARNSATKTIEQSLLFCGVETGKMIALRNIIRQGIQPPVLVFVQSKERAQELFHELIYDGMNVDVIHSDRTQLQRDNVIKSFRAGKIWILICTELMGRGIDFKGVNLVINYDFPNSAISYIHRIGRTGRAGRMGKAVTFFTEDDAIYLRSIANVMRTAGCPVPDYMLKINQPNRKERKTLAKGSIKRPKISSMSRYDQEKLKHKKKIIGDSRRKKLGLPTGRNSQGIKWKNQNQKKQDSNVNNVNGKTKVSSGKTEVSKMAGENSDKSQKGAKRKRKLDGGNENDDVTSAKRKHFDNAQTIQIKYKNKWKGQGGGKNRGKKFQKGKSGSGKKSS